MRKYVVTVLVVALWLFAPARPAGACSTFCAPGGAGPVFGKNYDWSVDAGLVLVNKRGVSKTAYTADNPARWTSRYGSVTFNQYGREMPCGGMNEAGLVVEIMWLDESEFPPPDDRASLPNLQWVQYQLDVSATVEEVIASDGAVRISDGERARIHFLVADRTGAAAAIEFLNGKMIVHAGESMPFPVLTNNTYRQSVAYLEQHKGFGGDRPLVNSNSSLDRFARAARSVRDFGRVPRESAVDAAFEILTAVSQGSFTQWSIVYDIDALRVYFRTHRNPLIRYVDLGGFDFSCRSPVQMLDIHAAVEGDAGERFETYTTAANLELVRDSYRGTEFLSDIPAELIKALASYPETTECKD